LFLIPGKFDQKNDLFLTKIKTTILALLIQKLNSSKNMTQQELSKGFLHVLRTLIPELHNWPKDG
jgi:hypothetical protein